MDAVVFTGLFRELAEKLCGARVNKVQQPSAEELLLRLWDGQVERTLYFNMKGKGHLALTARRFANPFTPPRFCQLLRSRLSRLNALDQLGGERLARLRFSGKSGECCLIVDLRFTPNLILVDDQGKIIDALRRDVAREILPGRMFDMESTRYHWLGDASLAPPADLSGADDFKRWLKEAVAPMSPWLAESMALEVAGGEGVTEVLTTVRTALYETAVEPVLLRVTGREQLSPAVFPFAGAEILQRYASLSESLDTQSEQGCGAGHDLHTLIAKAIDRLERRQRKIGQDAQQLQSVEQLQQQAELLAAQRQLLSRGMSSVDLDDYYSTPPSRLTIALDPKLSPQENIERKFKLVKKLRRGAEHIERRLEETAEELEWLCDMQLAVEECDDAVDRDLLARELAAAGYLKLREEPANRTRAKVQEPLRRTQSPGGYEIIWGKNPRGNDMVSTRIAHSEDVWFHVYRYPGCHLIIRRAGRDGDIPRVDIEFAASLAAGYSSARQAPAVEVMVCDARHVRKPKGARPGAVRVDAFETIRVAPQRLAEDHESV